MNVVHLMVWALLPAFFSGSTPVDCNLMQFHLEQYDSEGTKIFEWEGTFGSGEEGLVKEKITFEDSETIRTTKKHVEDERGRLWRIVKADSLGLVTYEEFEYAEKSDQVIRKNFFMGAPMQSVEPTNYHEYIYEDGLLVEDAFYSVKSGLVERTVFNYHSYNAHKLTREVLDREGHLRQTIVTVYDPDAQNLNLILQSPPYYLKEAALKEEVYDEHGDLDKAKSATFSYEWDFEHGRVVETISGYDGGQTICVFSFEC